MTDLSLRAHAPGRAILIPFSAAGLAFLPAGPTTGPTEVIERYVALAIDAGLVVVREGVPNGDEGLPLGDTPPDHVGRLRALRDRLVGPDKAAVRWALNRLASTDEKLAEIRRLAGK